MSTFGGKALRTNPVPSERTDVRLGDEKQRVAVSPDSSAKRAKHARELREHVHGVLAAVHKQRPVSQRDLDAIASAIRVARAARILTASSSGRLATYRWSRPATAEIPLHACALGSSPDGC